MIVTSKSILIFSIEQMTKQKVQNFNLQMKKCEIANFKYYIFYCFIVPYHLFYILLLRIRR